MCVYNALKSFRAILGLPISTNDTVVGNISHLRTIYSFRRESFQVNHKSDMLIE